MQEESEEQANGPAIIGAPHEMNGPTLSDGRLSFLWRGFVSSSMFRWNMDLPCHKWSSTHCTALLHGSPLPPRLSPFLNTQESYAACPSSLSGKNAVTSTGTEVVHVRVCSLYLNSSTPHPMHVGSLLPLHTPYSSPYVPALSCAQPSLVHFLSGGPLGTSDRSLFPCHC